MWNRLTRRNFISLIWNSKLAWWLCSSGSSEVSSSFLGVCPSQGAFLTHMIQNSHCVFTSATGEGKTCLFFYHESAIAHITSICIPLARIQSIWQHLAAPGTGKRGHYLGSRAGQLQILLLRKKGRMHIMVRLAASAMPFNEYWVWLMYDGMWTKFSLERVWNYFYPNFLISLILFLNILF